MDYRSSVGRSLVAAQRFARVERDPRACPDVFTSRSSFERNTVHLQGPFCPKSVPQSILPNPTNNRRLSVAPMSCRILIDIVGTYIQVERVQLSAYSIS